MYIHWNKKLSFEKQVDIYNFLSKHACNKDHFFRRELLTVEKDEFKKVMLYFSAPVRIGKGMNYRSNRYFKHIHAIQKGDHVQCHYDYGNPFKSLLLSSVHFFYGVIPYFVWHIICWKKPYNF